VRCRVRARPPSCARGCAEGSAADACGKQRGGVGAALSACMNRDAVKCHVTIAVALRRRLTHRAHASPASCSPARTARPASLARLRPKAIPCTRGDPTLPRTRPHPSRSCTIRSADRARTPRTWCYERSSAPPQSPASALPSAQSSTVRARLRRATKSTFEKEQERAMGGQLRVCKEFVPASLDPFLTRRDRPPRPGPVTAGPQALGREPMETRSFYVSPPSPRAARKNPRGKII
jgi:hypothetical protein